MRFTVKVVVGYTLICTLAMAVVLLLTFRRYEWANCSPSAKVREEGRLS